MGKTLYLTWHGATLFSSQGKLEGWSDSPLTDDSRRQAEACGRDYFAARDIRPAQFLSSHAERACDTLELICRTAWQEAPRYQRLKGLKDLNCGIYEAKDACLAPPAPYGDFFVKFGGESYRQLGERMRQTVADIARMPGTDDALVSTHQLAASALCATFDERLSQQVLDAAPCSVLALAYDDATDAFSVIDFFEPRG